jgi:hypothetical protein
MNCSDALKEFFQRDIKVLADNIQCADADIHLSGFDPAKVDTSIMIKLLLGNFFFLAKQFEAVRDLFKEYLVFYLGHFGQADKTLKYYQ